MLVAAFGDTDGFWVFFSSKPRSLSWALRRRTQTVHPSAPFPVVRAKADLSSKPLPTLPTSEPAHPLSGLLEATAHQRTVLRVWRHWATAAARLQQGAVRSTKQEQSYKQLVPRANTKTGWRSSGLCWHSTEKEREAGWRPCGPVLPLSTRNVLCNG